MSEEITVSSTGENDIWLPFKRISDTRLSQLLDPDFIGFWHEIDLKETCMAALKDLRDAREELEKQRSLREKG